MQQTLTEHTAREYIKLAGFTGAALIIISLPLSLAGALIANALGYDAALVGGLTFASAILIAALVGLHALRVTRKLFVDQIAAYIAKDKAAAKRIDAEAERILAEADRIDAESAAIKLSAERAAQLNLNTGSGNMKVNNKPTQYTVNGHAVGQLNLLNQAAQTKVRTILIPAQDVRWIAEQLANGYGHSKGDWKVNAKKVERIRLPYSGLSVDYPIYKVIMDALAYVDEPAIVGRGDRDSGELVVHDPAQLVKVIEQTHPDAGSKGITLELSAKTTGN